MNAARRKQLDLIIATLEGVKADLDIVRDEEQEAFDNMPESFRDGEKGERAQSALDAIEEATNAIDDVIGSVETAKE